MTHRIRRLVAGAAVAAVAPVLVGAAGTAPAHADVRTAFVHAKAADSKKQLETDYQAQQRGYWCGPAAARHALTALGKHPSQASLASLLHTTTGGTNSVADIKRGLNHYTSGYKAVLTPQDPMPASVKHKMWLNIKHSINKGRPVVVNIVAYAGSSAAPSHYPNSTIYHYFTVSGYDTHGANKVRIVDSAFGKPRYWLAWSKLARLAAQKGYVYY